MAWPSPAGVVSSPGFRRLTDGLTILTPQWCTQSSSTGPRRLPIRLPCRNIGLGSYCSIEIGTSSRCSSNNNNNSTVRLLVERASLLPVTYLRFRLRQHTDPKPTHLGIYSYNFFLQFKLISLSSTRPSLPIRENEVSRPPSYRSRSSASTAVEARTECQSLQPQQQQQQREEEPACTEALIHHQVMVEAKIKSAASFDDHPPPPPPPTKRDNNTVTIVQTNSSSQVLGCHNSQTSPVLVTVTTSPTVHHPPSSSPTHSQNLQVLAQLWPSSCN